LISRQRAKLEDVRASLETALEDGESHSIIAGDVSDRSFWEGVRKEEVRGQGPGQGWAGLGWAGEYG